MHAPSSGTRPYAWAIAFLLVQLSPHVLWTQDVRDGETEASSPSEVAARVDVLLAELHKEAKIDPAPRAADVEWLRRAYRALAGRTPRPEEVERFVEDSRPEKRAEVIDRLVASDEWARQLAGTWRDIILSRAQDPRARNVRDTIEDWLFARFRSNAGWDEIARDIITASGPIAERGDTGLIAAQMGQAEEIAAEVSRIFLGVQIQCAQCHDHPTAPWKRRQFHELAAYFSRLRLARTGDGPRGFEVVSIAVPAAREQAARQRFAGARFATDPLGVLERFDANDDGKLVEMELPESLQRPFRRIVRR
ncbi:MAG TPA: DUF1549 domain-containing protein, partial [Planctomycetota bacterium]|nr:DUF1549 domain-containing protein [Planctomycetota bacterium]